MSNVLFISEKTLKDRTAISEVIDGKQLRPVIKLAQDQFLQDALGSSLYTRLQAGVDADNLTTAERGLIDNYITDCLIYATLSYLAMPLSFQFFAKGTFQKTAEESSTPSRGDIEYIAQTYRDSAEWYKQRLINYLRTNYTTFSQYNYPGCGWDVISPVRTGYECSIYLGEDCGCGNSFGGSVSPAPSLTPGTIKYVATGGETSFTIDATSKNIYMAFRAGWRKDISTAATSDTNVLQIVGNTVTLPIGDMASVGELFQFSYI